MKDGFRQAMSWLHTWSGLVLGWLLFAIFLTGTLAFFRSELNQWTRPELSPMGAPSAASADLAQRALHAKAPGVSQWIMQLSDERTPAITLLWRDKPGARFETVWADPATGALRHARDTLGGDFFYRFHFELRSAKFSRWIVEGRWVVGAATLLMFVALLSGIVTHRRIFSDFFTFRARKGGQRAWMDAHNVMGVLVLPFYLMITFSGLMIFHTLYLPAGIAAVYRTPAGTTDSQRYFADLAGEPATERSRPRSADGAALPIVPLAPLIAQAQAAWPQGHVGSLSTRTGPDGALRIEVARQDGERLQYRPERLVFDAASGRLLQRLDATGPAARTYGVLYGLHLGRFAEPALRWMLFGFGLAGSAMIATGLVLWVVKRRGPAGRAKHTGPFGMRLVETLNLAALAGLPLAIAVFFAANRLLPNDLAARADAELQCFFGAWALCLALAAAWRGRAGWCTLLALGAMAFAALPLLNAATTSVHLGRTLVHGDWALAGVDLGFLGTAALLAAVAHRVHRRARHADAAAPPRAEPPPLAAGQR